MKFPPFVVLLVLALAACAPSRQEPDPIIGALGSRNRDTILIAEEVLAPHREGGQGAKIDFNQSYASQRKLVAAYLALYESWDEPTRARMRERYLDRLTIHSPAWPDRWE